MLAPAIIGVHEDVACIFISLAHEHVGCFTQNPGRDSAMVVIPAVPTLSESHSAVSNSRFAGQQGTAAAAEVAVAASVVGAAGAVVAESK